MKKGQRGINNVVGKTGEKYIYINKSRKKPFVVVVTLHAGSAKKGKLLQKNIGSFSSLEEGIEARDKWVTEFL